MWWCQDDGSVPIDTIRARMKATPISVNLATYTGQAWLRSQVMKDDLKRKATAVEIDSMKVILDRELDKGSLGLGTGLEYEAAFYSNRDEVVELAKVQLQPKAGVTSVTFEVKTLTSKNL
ncbi:MAG: hypothetical protein U5K54_28325 [Cytophagales bacterium]|nr:hypothetical protein [Cytophagales bacterium]